MRPLALPGDKGVTVYAVLSASGRLHHNIYNTWLYIPAANLLEHTLQDTVFLFPASPNLLQPYKMPSQYSTPLTNLYKNDSEQNPASASFNGRPTGTSLPFTRPGSPIPSSHPTSGRRPSLKSGDNHSGTDGSTATELNEEAHKSSDWRVQLRMLEENLKRLKDAESRDSIRDELIQSGEAGTGVNNRPIQTGTPVASDNRLGADGSTAIELDEEAYKTSDWRVQLKILKEQNAKRLADAKLELKKQEEEISYGR